MRDRKDLAGPHHWWGKGWRFWLCRECFAPRSLHPRTEWVTSRPVGNNHYLSANSPHFRHGW